MAMTLVIYAQAYVTDPDRHGDHVNKRMSAKHCEIHVECKNRNNSSTLVFLQIAYERKQEVGPHYATGELQNCKHRRFRLSTVSFTQDYFYKFTNTIFL